jgi:type IV pilus assembly protein PilE
MRHPHKSSRSDGFTIIELMVGVAVVGILAAVALPSYNAYIQRSRVPVGLDALAAYATRMEQRYQDTGSYRSGTTGTTCAVTLPTAVNFAVTCATGSDGQSFTATATGSGPVTGYTYTINSAGVRQTTAHPKGTPGSNCWTTKGVVCDS